MQAPHCVRRHRWNNDDATMSIRIVLNVSTVDSHRGKTLAGCEYRVEVK